MWVLTRYAEVDEALRDVRLSSTFPEGADLTLAALYAFVHRSLVFSDPPDHTRLRRLVSRVFTPRSVGELRPRIAQIVDEHLERAAPAARMELISELANAVPLAVLVDMLGLDLNHDERIALRSWCDDFLLPFGRDLESLTADERDRASASAQAQSRLVQDRVATVRAGSGDGLLALLVAAAEDGDRLTEDELFANVVLLLIAGHENLTSLISNGVVALLDHPDQLALVGEDPARWPNAIEELLRYVTPNQFIRRRALEPVELAGRTIAPGQSVLLLLASANRDPAAFPDPDRLDVGRPHGRNLALGHGFHYCLGAALAHLEAEIALRRLFERFPDVALDADELEYEPNFNLRLLRSLPVRLAP